MGVPRRREPTTTTTRTGGRAKRRRRHGATCALLLVALILSLLPALPPSPFTAQPAAAAITSVDAAMRAGVQEAFTKLVAPLTELPNTPKTLPLTDVSPFAAEAMDIKGVLGSWIEGYASRSFSTVQLGLDHLNSSKPPGVVLGAASASEDANQARLVLPVTFVRSVNLPVRVELPAGPSLPAAPVEGGPLTQAGVVAFTLDVQVDKAPGVAEDQAVIIQPAAPPTPAGLPAGTISARFTSTAATGSYATRFGIAEATITPAGAPNQPTGMLTFDTRQIDPNNDGRIRMEEWRSAPKEALLSGTVTGSAKGTFNLSAPIGGTLTTTIDDTNLTDTNPGVTVAGTLANFGHVQPDHTYSGLSNLQSALQTIRRMGGAQVPMLEGSLAPVLDAIVPTAKISELTSVVCNTARQIDGRAVDVPFQPKWYPAGTVFTCSARTPVHQAPDANGNPPALPATWRISVPGGTNTVTHNDSVGTEPTPVTLTVPAGGGLPMIEVTWTDLDPSSHVARPAPATIQDLYWLFLNAGIAATPSYDAAANEIVFGLSAAVAAGSRTSRWELGDSFKQSAGLSGVSTAQAATYNTGAASLRAGFVVKLDAPPAPPAGNSGQLPAAPADPRFSLRAPAADGVVLKIDSVDAPAQTVSLDAHAGFLALKGTGRNLAVSRVDTAKPAAHVALRYGTGILPTLMLGDIQRAENKTATTTTRYVEGAVNLKASGTIEVSAPDVAGLEQNANRSFTFNWSVNGVVNPTQLPGAPAPTFTNPALWNAVRQFDAYEVAGGAAAESHVLHDVLTDAIDDTVTHLTGRVADNVLDRDVPVVGGRLRDQFANLRDVSKATEFARELTEPDTAIVKHSIATVTGTAGNTAPNPLAFRLDGTRLIATLTYERCSTGMPGCLGTGRDPRVTTKLAAAFDQTGLSAPGLSAILPQVPLDHRRTLVVEVAIPLTFNTSPLVTANTRSSARIVLHGPAATDPVTVNVSGRIGAANATLTGKAQVDVGANLAVPSERTVASLTPAALSLAPTAGTGLCAPANDTGACIRLTGSVGGVSFTGTNELRLLQQLPDAAAQIAFPSNWGAQIQAQVTAGLDPLRVFDSIEAFLKKLNGVGTAAQRIPLIGERLDGAIGAGADSVAGLDAMIAELRTELGAPTTVDQLRAALARAVAVPAAARTPPTSSSRRIPRGRRTSRRSPRSGCRSPARGARPARAAA